MMNLAMLVAAIGFTGTIDRIEENFAHVSITFDNAEIVATDIPLALIPCEAREGSTLYIRKTSQTTEIRCSEFPPPTLEVQINPTTGETQYIIKDISLE